MLSKMADRLLSVLVALNRRTLMNVALRVRPDTLM